MTLSQVLLSVVCINVYIRTYMYMWLDEEYPPLHGSSGCSRHQLVQCVNVLCGACLLQASLDVLAALCTHCEDLRAKVGAVGHVGILVFCGVAGGGGAGVQSPIGSDCVCNVPLQLLSNRNETILILASAAVGNFLLPVSASRQVCVCVCVHAWASGKHSVRHFIFISSVKVYKSNLLAQLSLCLL